MMKHFAIIINEFVKKAVDSDWWKKLSPDEQKQYISQHKRTKLRPTPDNNEVYGDTQTMKRIFSSIPKQWKKTLLYNGVGRDSTVERLPDALRPRVMKQAFDNNTQAILIFKAGTPITSMEPEFIITKSYEDDKFSCRKYKDNQGNVLDQDAYSSYMGVSKPRYNRGIRYDSRKTDLRMSNLVEMIPNQAYTVFAIKTDPERQKLRQMRGEEKNQRNFRDIESKLIEKAAKPIYDYYSESLQKNIGKLNAVAIPAFENVLNADPYAKDTTAIKIDKVMQNIKDIRSKLNSLNYDIKSAGHLPYENDPYIVMKEDGAYNKNRVKSFLDSVKKLKTKYKDEYTEAMYAKKRDVLQDLASKHYEDAIDTLNSIGLKDIATKIEKQVESKAIVFNIAELSKLIMDANVE